MADVVASPSMNGLSEDRPHAFNGATDGRAVVSNEEPASPYWRQALSNLGRQHSNGSDASAICTGMPGTSSSTMQSLMIMPVFELKSL
jgi:hypothetical protein